MSTRDRIEAAVKALLEDIATVIDDPDITADATSDLIRLYAGIDHKLRQFNQPSGPDPLTDGGPTRDDLEGVVRHDQ